MMYYFTTYPSPIGELRITGDGDHIVELTLPCQESRYPEASADDNNPALHMAVQWLSSYFSGQHPAPSRLPLRPNGTAFQEEIWERLRRIPYGATVTYGQIANEIAQRRCIQRMSAQAVGQAVGANPISIIIPCHRVLGGGGKLTGYDGGLENKIWLLNHEK